MTLPRSISVLVLVLAVAAVLGVFPSYDSGLSYAFALATVFSASLYFVAAGLLRSWESARRLSYVLVLAAVLVVAYFLLQYGYGNYEAIPALFTRIGSMTTVLPDLGFYKLHPNSAATFAEGIVPLALALMWSARSLALRLLMALCTLFLLFGIAVSYSRGAYIALTVGAVLAILLLIRQRRALLFGFIALLIAAFVGATLLGLSDLALDWAGQRLELYVNSVAVGQDYLFTGIGMGGTFALVYSRFGLLIQVPLLQHPHNQLLGTWMGSGLLGLLALLALILLYPIYVLRVMRRSKPRLMFFAAVVGLVIILVHSLLDFIMPTAFILLGMTVALGQLALREAEAEPQAMGVRTALIAVAAVGLLLVATLGLFFKPLQTAWYTNLGALDETRAMLGPDLSDAERSVLNESARLYYQQALAIEPQSSRANRRLGNMDMRDFEFEAAVPHLEIAFAQDAAHPAAAKGLGLSYVMNGQIDEGVATLRLLNNDTGMSDELFTWGWYYGGEDMLLQRAYAWTAGIELGDIQEPRIWMAVGQVYEDIGEIDQATAWYRRILEVEPDNSDLRQRLQTLEAAS